MEIKSGVYLDRFYDPGLKLPKLGDREALIDREVQRLRSSLALVFVAGSISRRLGSEANDTDLAIDKKRAKRMTHALRQSMLAWIRKVPAVEVDDATRIRGTQLDWRQFADEHCVQLNSELRIVANWAMRHDDLRWGRTAIVNLENELRWVLYAMRD